MRLSRLSALPLTGLLALALTGCGSSSGTGASPTPGSGGGASKEAASQAPATGPDTPCKGSQISAEATVQEAGVALLAITNAGRATCRLDGWPRLGLLAMDGNPIDLPVEQVAQPGPATPTDLDPGETAFAGFKWTTCDKADPACFVAGTLVVGVGNGADSVPATFIGAEGGDQRVTELPAKDLTVGTIQPSTQGVVAW